MSSLSDRLQDIFARLKGKGKLSEADVNTAMREVRVALLEADNVLTTDLLQRCYLSHAALR